MPPTNMIDKSLTLTLGGIDRPFRFSFASYAYLTELYADIDEPFTNLTKWVVEKAKLDRVIVASLVDLVFAGLMTTDKNISRAQVADMLDLSNTGLSLLVILEARGISVPRADGKKVPKDPPAA